MNNVTKRPRPPFTPLKYPLILHGTSDDPFQQFFLFHIARLQLVSPISSFICRIKMKKPTWIWEKEKNEHVFTSPSTGMNITCTLNTFLKISFVWIMARRYVRQISIEFEIDALFGLGQVLSTFFIKSIFCSDYFEFSGQKGDLFNLIKRYYYRPHNYVYFQTYHKNVIYLSKSTISPYRSLAIQKINWLPSMKNSLIQTSFIFVKGTLNIQLVNVALWKLKLCNNELLIFCPGLYSKADASVE